MASSRDSPTQSKPTISQLATIVRQKINSVGPVAIHTIFRVPRNLREVDPKAYEPQVVSIGPYLHGKAGLEDMEMHKCRILDHVLCRTGHQVEMYLKALVQLEDTARRSYAEPVRRMETSEFIGIMLLDACFVIELLRASFKASSKGNPIFAIQTLIPYIQRDLVMVENQLPFFVLDRLFKLTCGDLTKTLPQLALEFFDSLIPGIKNSNAWNSTQMSPHLLALVHDGLGGCRPQSSSGQQHHGTQARIKASSSSSVHMVHSVTRLRECGVKFRKGESNNFMDIKFEKENGVLKIPSLLIHDSSKTIFLNLMAFEQRLPYCCNHVTSYLCFMDDLINTSQDVRHLCHKGIIDHGLGSEEEVAHLFNGLCREIAVDLRDCYLSGMAQDLKWYAEKKRHSWMASLKREYLRHPWAIIGLVVGFMILLLSFTQTVYTVLSYYCPRSR